MKKYIFINDTSTQNNWGCHSTSYHFEKFFREKELECSEKIFLKDLHDLNKTIKVASNIDLEGVDYIFVNGEGSIYDRQPKGLNLLKSIKIIKDRKPSLKVLVVNSTFDISDKFPEMRDALKSTSNLVDLYGPREMISCENLKKMKLSNIFVQPDFLYQAEIIDNKKYSNTIVIGGNSNYYRGDRIPYDASEAYSELVYNILKNFEYKIILYSSDNSDYRYLPKIAEKHNVEHVGCKELSWKDGLEILSNARMSISGRYHPSIMSLCGVTPCYFLSANNCKMEGTHSFFYSNDDNFSSSHRLLEDKNKIIDWIKKVELNYDDEVVKIQKGLYEMKNRILDFSNKVSEIIS